jgi:hypothetical protein
MDLKGFEAFLESQETALEAILKASIERIDKDDVRKAIDGHIARTTGKFRNVFPTVPNAAISPVDAARSSPSTSKKPTPRKPTLAETPSRRLFTSPAAGTGTGPSSGWHGRKRVAIQASSDDDDDDSSAGSPPESPVKSKKQNVPENVAQSQPASLHVASEESQSRSEVLFMITMIWKFWKASRLI